MGKRAMPKLKLNKRVLWFLLGGVACLLFAFSFTAWRIWDFDPTTERNADVAIVLGASTWDGKPSPAFRERINHGISLFNSNRVSCLIMSGGAGEGESVSLAASARQYALSNGVPNRAILVEPYSRITRENLKFSKQVASSHGLETFLIVSDPLHLKRALRMASELDMSAWPSATPTTQYQSTKSRWWFLRREAYFYIQYVLVTRFLPMPSLEAAEARESIRN